LPGRVRHRLAAVPPLGRQWLPQRMPVQHQQPGLLAAPIWRQQPRRQAGIGQHQQAVLVNQPHPMDKDLIGGGRGRLSPLGNECPVARVQLVHIPSLRDQTVPFAWVVQASVQDGGLCAGSERVDHPTGFRGM
jgi:hypothetical protein